MSDWTDILRSAAFNGVWMSITLTVIMIISGLIALDMWVGDYPPAIQARFGPMSPRAARIRPYFAAAFFIVALAIPLFGLFRLREQLGSVLFVEALVFGTAAMLVFNLYDLLILDWLLFCTIQPRSMILPGTEGMVAYRDYRFHFIGFLKGLGFCAISGPVIGGIWLLAQVLEARL